MKKKLITILATLALACAMGGCADFQDARDSSSQNGQTETSQGGESENSETSDTPITPPEKTHEYMDFTEAEKALFDQYIGGRIPFVPNNEYYVEGYYDQTGYEYGINFYTYGNTQEEFNDYLKAYEKNRLYLYRNLRRRSVWRYVVLLHEKRY